MKSLDELHVAVFEPMDDPGGEREGVMLKVPEDDIEWALSEAAEEPSRLLVLCDTAEQLAEIALLAAGRLRRHRRVAVERAKAGAFGPLS